MHLSDPFLSVGVGVAFWAISGGALARVGKKLDKEEDSSLTPLTGVMAAFVFAAQMVNFAIPGTGSSGHLGGALLMAYLLGSRRAFLAITSVLVVQCLFFADGGLLALGCNIFNMGFLPAFVVYPAVRRWTNSDGKPAAVAVVMGGVAGLLLGSLMVSLQVALSHRTAISLLTLLKFMIPIHLAIGLIEGLATLAILSFLVKVRPTLVPSSRPGKASILPWVVGLVALLLGGVVSWAASKDPDGLEWSMDRVGAAPVHHAWQTFTTHLAPFADYQIPSLVAKFGEGSKASTSVSSRSRPA